MSKRIGFLILIWVLIVAAACQPATPVPTPTQAGFSPAQIATLSALSTKVNTTPETAVTPSFTPSPTLDPSFPTITNTPLPGQIIVTGITQRSPDSALITWDVSGDFPSGFRVVWTDVQGFPTYPESNSIGVGSATARSAIINVTPGTIYYVRVCRFMFDSCDIYSDLGIFSFLPATSTPDLNPAKTATAAAAVKTATAAAAAAKATGTSSGTDTTLAITLMKGGDTGKAYMAWIDKVGSSKGYRIVYSKTNSTPLLTSDLSFYVSDPKARSAYVDGDSATKYYYRICRFNGSACTAYSATYTYTFPTAATATSDASTITISGITNVSTGSAQVNWTATGTFSNGFKILYSKTTALPTLADNVVVISDGTLRSGMISGDPSATYHVRVCKYSGSACTVYSPVVDFPFDADPAVITITELGDNATTAGSIDLTWTATGTFSNGFKLLYSSNSEPTISNSSLMAITDGSVRTATIPASANTHYYVRICKFTGSTCGVYSNIVEFTTATSNIILTHDPAEPSNLNKFVWTNNNENADHADGYKLFWTEGTIAPVWSVGSDQLEVVGSTLRTATISALAPGNTYMVRMCYWNTATDPDSCSGNYSNTMKVEIPSP